MTKLDELAKLGQAVWLDYIRRSFLTNGGLQSLIQAGVRGMTSNPSIFEKAIVDSHDYDADLQRLAAEGKPTQEIYEALVIDDIQRAADLLRPVYDQTNGDDGYVSLEVNPTLAHDTSATLAEAQRLWKTVDRPNLMIKIPATPEGIPAITQAIAAGVNVNVTLIFSLARYEQVMAAYLQGLELRGLAGQPIDRIASVASFFVSRVDTKVDQRLDTILRNEGPQAALASSLLGKAAVANAKLAYSNFRSTFDGERFTALKNNGARLQRPLWASTSTKNPAYSDILYVQDLIGPDTVNTLPQKTLDAFLDHGEVRSTLEENLEEAHFVLQSLADLGISMAQVTQELEDEGVAAFARSFEQLVQSIEEKRAQWAAQDSQFMASLGEYREGLEKTLEEMAAERIIPRIWNFDYTVWKPAPQEITNRLGWLHIAQETQRHLPQLEALSYAVQQAGYTHALLLGMGGSSLAPDVFRRTFGKVGEGLEIQVLDSTDPEAVGRFAHTLDPAHTLYIVSTKSGSTEETLSFFKFFYNKTLNQLGASRAGEHFIAITDPGSRLVSLAQEYHFRATFLNDPNIGGRYSALSYFGMVPGALSGIDLAQMLARADKMAGECGPDIPPERNPAARLGAILGDMAKNGRDKLTFIISKEVAPFGDWVEQLIAESTGKEGSGILPVVGEPIGSPEIYGSDRLFIHMDLTSSKSSDADRKALSALEKAGQPVLRFLLSDLYDLGGQFFLWELATAVAGYRLGINPFDQPNVESAKVRAREMVKAYKEKGALPAQTPSVSEGKVQVFGKVNAASPGETLVQFLKQAKGGDYIALQAFIPPTDENLEALQELRLKLRYSTHLATTSGFGPRFLHSTGQLHKGDGGHGLFIQFTSNSDVDLPIPDEAGRPDSSIGFGVLKLAQAMGDLQALQDANRRAIRFHIEADLAKGIRSLARAVETG